MPITALLCLAALATPATQEATPWAYHRFGDTGLQLFLPQAPQPKETTGNKEAFTLQHQGMTVEVTVEKANEDTPLPETERYLQEIGQYREKHGRNVTGILNESDVIAALRFGATASIGFTLEIAGGNGLTIGWHLVRINGYDYEIKVNGEKKHFPWVMTVLESQRYVDRATGNFKSAKIGGLGVEALLGTAFLSLTGVDPSEATSLVLQGNNIPVVGVAQNWVPGSVDYSSPTAVTAAFVNQLVGSNIAQNPLIDVKETTRQGTKTYEMTGEVYIETKKIVCEGVAFVFEDRAASIVVLYDPEDAPTAKLAKEILASAKPLTE